MSNLYAMRRANGDLFTEDVGGRIVIPVWTSTEAVARYKERNPDLIIFFPTRVDQGILNAARARERQFLLLPDDDPDADLEAGRPVSPDELLSMSQQAPEPARAWA